MANILYLVHRLPYPPDKGDKVRSYHILEHLRAKHRVFVGTFVDDPADEVHVEPLRQRCAELHAVRLHRRRARVFSLAGLARGEALTLAYYRDSGMARWVQDLCARERIDALVVFSSAMVQYAELVPKIPMLLDLVDVDSAKWAEYAQRHRWPMSAVYRREAAALLEYERRAAMTARQNFLSTDNEANLFRTLAPECAAKVIGMRNGVDAKFFEPQASRASPFASDELAVVFTGAMDYWPNVDGVTWFVHEALPRVRSSVPKARFYIVGRNPVADVRALASESVTVTGTVDDVRPYLQFASVVVVPLRLARGIQNKVLEAMAMARPVVASSPCAAALFAVAGVEIVAAQEPDDYVAAVISLLGDAELSRRIGERARDRVLASYGWPSALATLDEALSALPTPGGKFERGGAVPLAAGAA